MRDAFYFTTKGLTVGYQGVPLIRDITLSLNHGEILTLIGPNGAGKTTILKSIIRQLTPIDGVICLDGRTMEEIGSKALAEELSVVLTERLQTEMMSCAEVVATGRYPYTGRFGVLSEADHRIVEETMALVQILDLADCDFSRISDGQRQRVLLARALAQEPKLLILDEPTSFLDIKYKLEFLTILQRMSRERNLSVILSLHELDLAGRISHRIACVHGDRIERLGPPEEIFSGNYIPELYGLSVGSYEERTGNLELAAVAGEPRVFVLAGCGTGTGVFRRLQRENVPFAVGILPENDLDYPSAKALAVQVISVKPYFPIDDALFAEAREVMARCEKVICTLDLDALGPGGEQLRRLYAYAAEHGLCPA